LSDAATVLERCVRLATISEEPHRLVRRYGTDALRHAHDLAAGWMRDAGLTVREDAVGNLIGRTGEGPAMVLGSHLDTVVDAGRFDGPLGVLVGLAAVERVRGRRPPPALEVVSFADEEGVRYGTSYLGSSAMTGRFDPAWLDRRDADGVQLRDVLPGDPAAALRDPSEFAGYCEVHIEQGRRLEKRNLPVGVVTGIVAQSHLDVTFTGEAGHAGTTPMLERRDALAAAAELVLAAESAGRARDELVATVGQVAVEPGARNVIPGAVRLTLDVRHPERVAVEEVVEELRERALDAARARDGALDWRAHTLDPVPMSEELSGALAVAVHAQGVPVARLPSRAGHDAASMAAVTRAAMLFVRCRGGISHHPDEHVEEADVAVAIDVIERLLRDL
jgi:allantoate deiminase